MATTFLEGASTKISLKYKEKSFSLEMDFYQNLKLKIRISI